VKDAAAALEPTKTIELETPIEWKGASYAKLDLREPTGGEVLKASRKNGMDFVLLMVQQVSGLPEQVVQQLPIRPVNQAMAYISSFLDAGKRKAPDGEDAEPQPDELIELESTKTIELAAPIEWNADVHTRIDLREPTAGELQKASSKGGMDYVLLMIHQVSGAPMQIVHQLPIRVVNEAMEYISDFLAAGQETGAS
jgi:hypothetical protein